MEKFKEFVLIAGIIIGAVLLYVLMPDIFNFVAKYSKGSTGLIFFGAVSVIIALIYFLFGYRGKSLLYVISLVLFIALMIWLYFNYRSIDAAISSRYGQGVATVIFLVIIAIIWLFTRFML